MQINYLCPTYAVSPQITPDDIPALVDAGFTTVICNRPDAEIPSDLCAQSMREAAEAAGLTFVDNPFSHTAFSMDLVNRQQEARSADDGKVFAYCASGNRCSILWGLGNAQSKKMSIPEIVTAAAKAGYDLRGMAPQMEAITNA